jgi:hypothetical protein
MAVPRRVARRRAMKATNAPPNQLNEGAADTLADASMRIVCHTLVSSPARGEDTLV